MRTGFLFINFDQNCDISRNIGLLALKPPDTKASPRNFIKLFSMKFVDYTGYTLKLWCVFNRPVHTGDWIFLRCVQYTSWTLSILWYIGCLIDVLGFIHILRCTWWSLRALYIFWRSFNSHTLFFGNLCDVFNTHVRCWPFSEIRLTTYYTLSFFWGVLHIHMKNWPFLKCIIYIYIYWKFDIYGLNIIRTFVLSVFWGDMHIVRCTF